MHTKFLLENMLGNQTPGRPRKRWKYNV